MLELNKVYNGDCLDILKLLPDKSVNLIITSPPYFNLRRYSNSDREIGLENTPEEYIDSLIKIFSECYRVLTDEGSLWINISDTYKKGKLCCIPDRLKIKLSDNGWICRNEIIWHKPNAMPCSAKNRFNNDYEKFFFFVKTQYYNFHTQYEECKCQHKISNSCISLSKYDTIEQETKMRQGINRNRGNKIVELRKELPNQKEFVQFMRQRLTIDLIANSCSIKRTTIEHWFRNDKCGFSYPKVSDWEIIKELITEKDEEYDKINRALTSITYETDDVLKNINQGRLKRAVWDINTKPSTDKHFAMFPEKLVEIPINACSNPGDIVLDPFSGSGTTGAVALKLDRNFIGIDINEYYCKIANEKLNTIRG